MSARRFAFEDIQLAAHAFQPQSLAGGKHGEPLAVRQPEGTAGGEPFVEQLRQGVGAGGLRRDRIEPVHAQLGFHSLALGFRKLAVVNTHFGELSLEARAGAGARSTQVQSGYSRIGREGVDALALAGGCSVAVKRDALRAPGQADQLQRRDPA